MFGNDDYGDGGYWFLAPVGSTPPGYGDPYGTTLGPPKAAGMHVPSVKSAAAAWAAAQKPADIVVAVPGQRAGGKVFRATATKKVNGVWFWVMTKPDGRKEDIGAYRNSGTVQGRLVAAAAKWGKPNVYAPQVQKPVAGGMSATQQMNNQPKLNVPGYIAPAANQVAAQAAYQAAQAQAALAAQVAAASSQAATPGATPGTMAIGASNAASVIDNTSESGIVQMTSTGSGYTSDSSSSGDLPVQQASMPLPEGWDKRKIIGATLGLAGLAAVGYMIYNYQGWDFMQNWTKA